MTAPPESERLDDALAAVLGDASGRSACLVTGREPNPYASTTTSELVTCRLSNGHEVELFCKYGCVDPPESFGHRGGLAYEAFVHRHVLEGSVSGPPRLRGTFALSSTELGLVFDSVRGALSVDKAPSPDAIVHAAAWIARFHALHELGRSTPPVDGLLHYDSEYLVGWADRTMQLAGQAGDMPRWLPELVRAYRAMASLLVERSPTVIHGEYYPHNVLAEGDMIHPVDWETAAVAAGEIDLAALTDGWPIDAVARCEAVYRSTRWPEGAPAAFEDTLLTARLYLHLRWLGDRLEWTTAPRELRRWRALRRIAARLERSPVPRERVSRCSRS